MKKPFVFLNRPREIAKAVLCIILCACAISLFFTKEDSKTVFSAGENRTPQNLYGLVGSWV